MDWSAVDYCDVFSSPLDAHSDGTHSLQSEAMSNKLIYILDGLRSILSIFKVLGELFL